MKFYDPFKVVDRTDSLGLAVCLVLIVLALISTLCISLLIYPALTIKILAALVISRVVYAIIKGD